MLIPMPFNKSNVLLLYRTHNHEPYKIMVGNEAYIMKAVSSITMLIMPQQAQSV